MIEASIVIGYHNEAGLIQLLLESITDNIKSRVEVILVDDASTETYDYDYDGNILYLDSNYGESLKKKRKGIGHAFDIGVKYASTYNIILCGGDIVFKGDKWLDYFLEDLQDNDQSIVCGVCLNLHEHALDVNAEAIVKGYGAYIIPFVEETTVFQTKWFGEPLDDKSKVFHIPCILGAVYAIDKDWYEFIRGFEGHLYWGCLEPYISIKNWMLGGTNVIDTRVEAGHWFIGKQNRFDVTSWNIAYNKLLTTLLLGGELKEKLFDHLNFIEGIDIAVKYVQEEKKKEIEELRSYVDDHKVR